MAVETKVNKDGSITTSLVDEDAQAPESAEAEAKVVKSPAKPAAKARSTAESK